MILVTGGAGFVGSHLIPRLVETGENVKCLDRSLAKAGTGKASGAELVLGDVSNRQSLEQAMSGVESVIHLVAILRESKGATFDGVNVQGTKNVVQAALGAGVKRFIHIGALGAGPNPRYRYAYSKWQGEEAVRSSNLDYTILEPSIMFGTGAGFITRLIRSLKTFPFLAPIPGSGKTRFQTIWVEDVATCVLKALGGEKSRQTCKIGGPEHLTYEQILDAVIDALGTKRIKVHLPLLLMRPAVTAMEKVMSDPPVTLGELKQLEVDNTTDLDSVERQFGFKPLPLSQGLDYIKPAK
ncbi:MAG: complex I NDUFA9 subunit family protein [Dehalococcoidales bacterium]